MTELDPELMKLVHRTPPEELEQMVLQHVRLSSRRSKKGKTIYRVTDLQDNFIADIPYSVWAKDGEDGTPAPAKIIAYALLQNIMCGDCGDKLLEGESGTCTLCEARQIADLRRLAAELTD